MESQKEHHYRRFSTTCMDLGTPPVLVRPIFEELWEKYSDPRRTYHNIQHIERMLDGLADMGVENPEIEIAIWFHDAIYDPTRKDNEFQSAVLFEKLLGIDHLDAGKTARITQMIMATQHKSEPSTDYEKIIVDLDLSTLAAPKEEYETYREGVYAEYSATPALDFLRGRSEFLKELGKKFQFHTDYWKNLQEKAKENLAREAAMVENAIARGGQAIHTLHFPFTFQSKPKESEPAGPILGRIIRKTIRPKPTMNPQNAYYLNNGEVRVWNGQVQMIDSPILVENATIGVAPAMTPEAAMNAVDAATAAWNHGRGEWPSGGVDRSAAVRRFAKRLREKRDEIANFIVLEIAKTRKDAEAEVDRTIQYIEDTCDAYDELTKKSSEISVKDGIIAATRRTPLGVTLCMGPFNYPFNETYTTLIPALIMGNTLVVKPAKYGILLHNPTLEAFAECFPPGVVNFIYGDGATIINPIMASGKIDVFAFIGSSRVASILKKQHPNPHRLRSILGLDAKNPAIVMPSADLKAAAAEIIKGAFSYNGQRCTAIKFVHAHASIAEELTRLIGEMADNLTAGHPEENPNITPLVEEGKAEWLEKLIDDAVRTGATKVTRNGGRTSTPKLFRPVVLADVPAVAELATVEQFGPVLPIGAFTDINTVIDRITASNFGQQAAIFSTDPDDIQMLVHALANQVCRININCQCQRGPDHLPFAGRKDSAEGTLSVTDALRCFSIRNVIATSDKPLATFTQAIH